MTVRASPVFVRADSISTVDIVPPARIGSNGFGLRSSFPLSRCPFDLLRLVRTACFDPLGTMQGGFQFSNKIIASVEHYRHRLLVRLYSYTVP